MCTICDMRASKLIDADKGAAPAVHVAPAGSTFGGLARVLPDSGEPFGGGVDFLLARGDASDMLHQGGPLHNDNIPASNATTVTLAPGRSVSSAIDTAYDHDWLRVELVAGQSYSFSTAPSPGGATLDTTLSLRTAAGSQLAFNDDASATTRYSTINFTATSSGTYYLDVGAYSSGIGNYTAFMTTSSTTPTPPPPPTPPGDIAGNAGTTAALAIGGEIQSAIDVSRDSDWLRVELVAGQTYVFTTRAPAGGSALDSTLTLRNASGGQLAFNDDSAGGWFSRITYTATTSGTYYLDVGAYVDPDTGVTSTGGYIASAAIAPPLRTFTNDEIARQLTHDAWGGTSHAFNVSAGGRSIWVDYSNLTQSGQNLAREALALWSDVTGIRFISMPGSASNGIIFDDNEDGAFASSSYSGNTITSSRVNVSTQWLTDYGTGLNSYSFMTYIHEIGHALGLGHAGDYNGSASYPDGVRFLNDSWATTVMSYFDQQENPFFRNLGFTEQFMLTPMPADAIAAVNLYGSTNEARTGDTTYGFNNTSGRAVYDASANPSIGYAIVDHGGIDTLDYSGFSQTQRIDLNPENYSNVGGRTGNVTITRGSVIENAIGGSGADTLIGNGAANSLRGNAGDDVLEGRGGNDTIIGGDGFDIAIFSGGRVANLGGGQYSVTGADGVDILSGVERIRLGNSLFALPENFFNGATLVTRTFGTSGAAGGWSSDEQFPRTMADVNGDGRADIVGFGIEGTYVSLANSNGGFGEIRFAINAFGAGPNGGNWTSDDRYPRVLADVNGDGRADIVGFGIEGTYVSLGNGSGGFGNMQLATRAFGAGSNAGNWTSDDRFPRTLADVNGDGRADIVGFGIDGVHVALANGSGGFGDMQLVFREFGTSAGGWGSNDRYPRMMADVNGDRLADIVGFGDAGVYVALANGSGGFGDIRLAVGEFGAVAGGWASDNRYPRMIADVNGDGRADIVGFGDAGMYVALGNANGGFGAVQLAVNAFGVVAGGWENNDRYPRMLADVNGDGLADIVGFGIDGVNLALGAALVPIA